MAPHLSRRQLLGLGGGAAAALALSGCGGGSSSSGSASSTDLSWFMWSASTAEVDAWKKVADIAGEASGSTITFQTAAWNDYWTKLTSQAASGQTADLVSVQSLRAPQFAQLFTDLGPKLSDMGVTESDFDSGILDALKVDGKLLALPYDFGPLVVFYNKTAFQEAGLPMPAIGWTQDDFLAAAKKLTTGNTYGFFAGAVPDSIIPFAMSQHGVQAVTADGKLDIDTDEWRDTLNWYRDLVVSEKVASPLPAAGSQAAATNQFLAGNAAMNIDGPWSLINAKATASFEVGIAPMPVGGSGSKTVSAGSGFGVSAKAANQDLAAKACAGLVNVDSETYLGQSGRAFPARTAQQSAWYEGNGLQDAQEVMDAMIAAAEGYRTTAKWTQVNNEWNKYAVPCFNGDTDVDSFIQQVQAQA
ncbi:sugar ABC transporter substrate-binding protein [Quadrisphaera sp. INWT6]|uniref:ABC transporter substrate-binding protein n=1 Tax=Quadrisphaera sp. INWT6 TaxID=2596917 RepID=UPI00189234E4|nr:sugar ABC transporter substrate-binding protein [Quadrisphaera sp. INWT6]MBF5080458.1 sugar ABC transporter substrate-binding protein [Quadrisphaera sp. INWT6]